MRFDLKPLGALSISGEPAGAAVQVTGPGGFKDDGGLPWEATGLKSGTYSVKVSRKGYIDTNESIQVTTGKTATLKIALQKIGAVKSRIEPKSGLEFLSLPGGSFHLGCEPGDKSCDNNEQPGRKVTIAPFWLGKTEVTVEAYGRCVNDGACSPPNADLKTCNWNRHGDHPVNCIDWNQAKTFCEWVGGRLPTAEEWEYAAKSGESRVYPWGSEQPTITQARFAVKGGTATVGSSPSGASRHGILDLVGNVSEWTASSYDTVTIEVRGAAWNTTTPTWLRASSRFRMAAGIRDDSLGVRCAM